MKKKYWLLVPAVVLLGLAGVSCKSAPPPDATETAPPAAETPPPGPAEAAGPDQAALDTLNKAVARAEEARKRAVDFESPSYFPSEWEAAEGQYAAARDLPKTTGAEAGAAAMAHNAAADTYDGLFSKTIPLYAQAREDEIIAARNELVATGLTGSFPEYLRAADEAALAALNQYEKEDYYAARDTAAGALEKYQTLKLAADALLARQEIVDRNFAGQDAANFSQADEAISAAAIAYNEGNTASARTGAEDALDRYNQVLNAGWAAYAADMGEAARKARQAALELKANVAVRDTFNEAEEQYKQAAIALNARQYRDAAVSYTGSEARFVVAGEAAAEKRRIAEQAITEAEQKIEASEEAVKQAELVIQGGSI
jgi:hypothetical protein